MNFLNDIIEECIDIVDKRINMKINFIHFKLKTNYINNNKYV